MITLNEIPSGGSLHQSSARLFSGNITAIQCSAAVY